MLLKTFNNYIAAIFSVIRLIVKNPAMTFKKLCFLLLLFTTTSSVKLKAQTAAKSVYAELFGPGFASINFDSRFTAKEDGIGGRIGFSGFNTGNQTVFFFPAGLNYLVGKDEKHYFEMGGGATFMTSSQTIFNNNKSSSAFGYLQLGYRMQPKNGGYTFRVNMTPVFGRGFFIPYYFGISFGYKF
ncbi:MAG: hypothetical protein C0459_07735 [Chitinophaga sp.]|jgi:hypothetical protein|nr:hypothetical protein [Chitinophaga sp.]